MKTSKTTLAAFVGLVACGCATTRDESPADIASACPRKVILVRAPLRPEEEQLHKLFASNLPQESPESRQAIRNAIDVADAHALAEMRQVLGKRLSMTFDESDVVSRLVDELQIKNPDIGVTGEMASRLHATSDADALLRFWITDYGITPKSWRSAVIIFEVTTTLGIAAIAYAYPATRAVAGVYLVEEGIEETVEGYAGFWALNEVGRPVRIEAEFVSLSTGTQIWKGSTTGFSDMRFSRLVRKVTPEERDAQLNGATDRALANIVAELGQALSERDTALQSEGRNSGCSSSGRPRSE